MYKYDIISSAEFTIQKRLVSNYEASFFPSFSIKEAANIVLNYSEQKNFVINSQLQNKVNRPNDFHILFLKLDVGRMTPMFIQESFWTFINTFDGVYDVIPGQIENKGQAIKANIVEILTDVRQKLEK